MGKGGGRISNRIRDLRSQHQDLTQQALADRVGVTRQTIHAIEANKYSPSLEVAFRIAAVLGCSLDEVFSYDERSPHTNSATTSSVG